MNTPHRRVFQALVLFALVLILGSCSGMAEMLGITNGKDGATGATGAEGPNLYLENTTTGERIYSGGSVFLGLITSGTTTSTFEVINKTGDSLAMTGSPNYLVGGSSRKTTYAGVTSTNSDAILDDDSGLAGVLADGATSGNTFSLTLVYASAADAVTYKRFTLPLHDDATGEDILLSFEAYGMCGS